MFNRLADCSIEQPIYHSVQSSMDIMRQGLFIIADYYLLPCANEAI
jgi:hypothetical protein